MPNNPARKRWLISGAFGALLLIYFCTYLHLRWQHVFIHRAGNYAYDARLQIERHTNHYIEPGMIADGPQIFAMAALASVAADGDLNTNEADFESILEKASEELAVKDRKRSRIFAFFKPAAFLECVVWKIIDPNPLAP